MANIGDLFFGFRGDDKQLQVDAKKAGEAAGAAAGLAMSQSLGSQFKRGLPGAFGNFATGIAQGMGQEAWRGIERAIGDVVNAIPNLIEQGKAWGLLVDDIADATGASAQQASVLAGSLAALGIPTAGLAGNFRILSTQIATNEALFARYGIAVRDTNGLQLDTVTVLDNVRRYLAGLTDGADKAALATKLLGRSALDLIDYLNLTDDQAASLSSRLEEMGLIVGEKFRAEAEKAKRETSLLDLAFTGLGVTLQAEVGPIIRGVIAGITQFIIDNMQTIREVVATVASAIAGLVSGLLGFDASGIGTYVDALGDLGGSGDGGMTGLTLKAADLETQIAANNEVIAKGTQAAGANTSAVDKQTAAIERQITAIERREAAAEKAYQREIANAAKALQAQLDLLDAEERRLDIQRRDADLQAELLAAQEALRTAQTAGPGGTVDREAEAEAQRRIAAAQAAIRENEREKDVAARRDRLEETKAYIENLAQLEADAENRKALANTLANRRKVLEEKLATAQAAGDADEVARITAKLEAVKTTETRNNAAMRSETQKTELEETKARLAELKKAITSSIGGGTSEAVKEAIKKNRELQAELVILGQQINALYTKGVMSRTLMGAGGEPPLGSGGGLANAWAETAADWKATGEDLKAVVDDVASSVQSLIDKVGELARALAQAGLGWRYLTDEAFRNEVDRMARAQGRGTPSGGIGDFLGWLGDVLFGGQRYFEQNEGRASGGLISAGQSAWVGEAGMERAYSLPGGGTYIQPLASSAGGLAPAVIRLEIGGRPLVDYIDEQLAYRPRR